MGLFVLRPDPQGVAATARTFAVEEAQRSKLEMDAAEKELNSSQTRYDVDETNFKVARELNRAEERFEAAKARHATNLSKLNWEARREWMRRIDVPQGAMPTPWIQDLKNWLNIFRHRKNKPTQ